MILIVDAVYVDVIMRPSAFSALHSSLSVCPSVRPTVCLCAYSIGRLAHEIDRKFRFDKDVLCKIIKISPCLTKLQLAKVGSFF